MSVKVPHGTYREGLFFAPCTILASYFLRTKFYLSQDQTHIKRRPNPDQTQAIPLFKLCFVYVRYMFDIS
jgi:hypothetical protein